MKRQIGLSNIGNLFVGWTACQAADMGKPALGLLFNAPPEQTSPIAASLKRCNFDYNWVIF
jgi:hypothetical protein